MKRVFCFLVVNLILLLTSFKCESDYPDGHEIITLINQSNENIHVIQRWQIHISPSDTFFICNSAGQWNIEKGKSIQSVSMDSSWEKDFEYLPFIQFFILSEDYNIHYCNEEKIKELTEKYVLKRYLLTKEDLEELNWTITYP